MSGEILICTVYYLFTRVLRKASSRLWWRRRMRIFSGLCTMYIFRLLHKFSTIIMFRIVMHEFKCHVVSCNSDFSCIWGPEAEGASDRLVTLQRLRASNSYVSSGDSLSLYIYFFPMDTPHWGRSHQLPHIYQIWLVCTTMDSRVFNIFRKPSRKHPHFPTLLIQFFFSPSSPYTPLMDCTLSM